MAINYEKVGWDTTKYFNPSNMNHMDDGIKAACDKADANESAIAEVNSNLKNNLQYGTVQFYSNPELSKIICIKSNKYVHVKTFFTLASDVKWGNSLGEISTIFSPSETVNADYVMYKNPSGSVYYYCDNATITSEGKIYQKIAELLPSGAVLYCEFDYLIS